MRRLSYAERQARRASKERRRREIQGLLAVANIAVGVAYMIRGPVPELRPLGAINLALGAYDVGVLAAPAPRAV